MYIMFFSPVPFPFPFLFPFRPGKPWTFPVFLWYCICTSTVLVPLHHLILQKKHRNLGMAEETLSVQITCIVYVVVKNQIQVKIILTYFDFQLTLLGLEDKGI